MKFNYDDVVKDDNPILREKSAPVNFPLSQKDRTLLLGMLTYVKNSVNPDLAETENLRPAVGIAAIQLGIKKQMVAIALQEDEDEFIEYALINPKIISHSVQNAYLKNGEGCLSVEEVHEGYVYRHARITVKAYDLIQGKDVKIRVKGYEAIVMQHEIDHLNGILYYDHIRMDNPYREDPEAVVIE